MNSSREEQEAPVALQPSETTKRGWIQSLPPEIYRKGTMAVFFGYLLWPLGIVAMIIVAIASIATGPVLSQLVPSPRQMVVTGIVVVVVLGASGLILRGLGELRSSTRWKAFGYFLGACAYLATASVSLSSATGLLPPK